MGTIHDSLSLQGFCIVFLTGQSQRYNHVVEKESIRNFAMRLADRVLAYLDSLLSMYARWSRALLCCSTNQLYTKTGENVTHRHRKVGGAGKIYCLKLHKLCTGE